MSTPWSQQLCSVFGVVLPDDVVDWVDGDVRKMCEGPNSGEFTEPIEPGQLLDPDSSIVWGGLMLSDTLPILGNGCGDVLCLRFAKDGTVKDVIKWNHEGGAWRPFGRSLYEAVICDIATSRAEDYCDADDPETRALEEWALSWCPHPGETRSILAEHLRSDRPVLWDRLLGVKIGETVFRRDKCRLALSSGLSNNESGWGRIAEKAELATHDFPTWLFDTSMIPETDLPILASSLDMEVDVMTAQDWPTAASEAAAVVALSPSLGWPYVILGRHAERSGSNDDAVGHYLQSLERHKTSFDFLDMFGEEFALSRILALETTRRSSLTEYLQIVIDSKPNSSAIREYWMNKARVAEKAERHDVAYDSYYNAGWDAAFTNDMDEVLDGIAGSATNAGFSALGLIAKHHRKCIAGDRARCEFARDRMGLLRRIWTRFWMR